MKIHFSFVLVLVLVVVIPSLAIAGLADKTLDDNALSSRRGWPKAG
jgi:hypothetical protein